MQLETLRLDDGRTLEFCRAGPEDAAELLVFHVGTPSAAACFSLVVDAAAARDVRTVSYSRAGHGGSTRSGGRTVAVEAANTAALVDHLGVDRFLVAGWSGGGPGALACAALLPARVRACVVLAGSAPSEEVGEVWFDWQPEEERDELHALADGDAETVRATYDDAAAELATLTPEGLVDWPQFPEVDRRAFARSPRLTDELADSIRRAVAGGPDGWLDDASAAAQPWGFHVGDIAVPVTIRHGALDGSVRVDHGTWLAEHVPGARAGILPEDGHISIVTPFDEVIDGLLAAAS